jgi:hypothetical protein
MGGDLFLVSQSLCFRGVTLGVLLCLWASSAVAKGDGGGATAFPIFDIAASCASVSDHSTCEQIEAGARAQLGNLWDGLPKARKTLCRSRGEGAGGSYVAALSCVNAG